MPRWPRSMASVRPTGPAPTIRTWVSDNKELLEARPGWWETGVLASAGVLPGPKGGVIWRGFPGLYPVPPGPAGLPAGGPSRVGTPGKRYDRQRGRQRDGTAANRPDALVVGQRWDLCRQPAVPQIRRAVRRRGLRGAADQRPVRNLVLVSGEQAGADPHPARAGRGRGRQDRPVHQGHRGPDRLDHATAVDGERAGAAPLRRAAPAAPGAGDHRACAARRQRQGTAPGVAARHGRGRRRHRLFQGSEVHRSGGQEDLLRPGLLPPRVRALHDAGDGRRAARRRRQRRRGEPEVHLGRGLADQGRQEGPGLRGRQPRPADRASRHQPGAAQHRHVAARLREGGARRPAAPRRASRSSTTCRAARC